MNIPRFTVTGFEQDTLCAEITSDDKGAWVLYEDVQELEHELEQLKQFVKLMAKIIPN